MMMLETIISVIKGLPSWLGLIAEVILVALIFATMITFISGIWCGLRVVGKRAQSIKEINFFPPKILFYEKNKKE
jgi:hypothetical protein